MRYAYLNLGTGAGAMAEQLRWLRCSPEDPRSASAVPLGSSQALPTPAPSTGDLFWPRQHLTPGLTLFPPLEADTTRMRGALFFK